MHQNVTLRKPSARIAASVGITAAMKEMAVQPKIVDEFALEPVTSAKEAPRRGRPPIIKPVVDSVKKIGDQPAKKRGRPSKSELEARLKALQLELEVEAQNENAHYSPMHSDSEDIEGKFGPCDIELHTDPVTKRVSKIYRPKFGSLAPIDEDSDYVSSDHEGAPTIIKGERPSGSRGGLKSTSKVIEVTRSATRTRLADKKSHSSSEADSKLNPSYIALPSSDSESEAPAKPVYERPNEIEFVVAVNDKIQTSGKCDATNWEKAQEVWVKRCGHPMIGPMAHFPPFAFRFADQPKSSHATVLQSDTQYYDVVREVLAREELRYIKYLSKDKQPPASAKSKLPLSIMVIQPEPVTSTVTGGKKSAASTVAGRKAQGTDNLRRILYGDVDAQGGAYNLDRGERNEDGMRDGNINPRTRSAEEAMTDILLVYRCSKHGGDSCCYVPRPGQKYVGEHLRMDLSLLADLSRWLGRNAEYDLAAQGLPASYRKMLEAKWLKNGGSADDFNNQSPGVYVPVGPLNGAIAAANWIGQGHPLTAVVPTGRRAVSDTPAALPAPAPPLTEISLWTFPIAKLDQPLHMYPKIWDVLTSLDGGGGARYVEYYEIFTIGLETWTVGELLFWLHGEVKAEMAAPVVLLVKEMVSALDVNAEYNQHQRFSKLMRAPTTILASLMIHEFERVAIVYENEHGAD